MPENRHDDSRNPKPAFWISFGVAGIAIIIVAIFRFPSYSDRAYFITMTLIAFAVAALPWIAAFRVKGLFEITRAVEQAKEETKDQIDAVQEQIRLNFSNIQNQINQQTVSQTSLNNLQVSQVVNIVGPPQREETEDAERQITRLQDLKQDKEGEWQLLNNYVREYETLRLMPPGYARTLSMTTVVDKVKTLANKMSSSDPENVNALFKIDSDGERLVALAMMQIKPSSSYLNNILDALKKSRSAFEQYQALLAAERIISLINNDQKQSLVDVLKDQRSGGPGKYITRDSDRWNISTRILSSIQ